jgi:small-conductance mechanosensitive channel
MKTLFALIFSLIITAASLSHAQDSNTEDTLPVETVSERVVRISNVIDSDTSKLGELTENLKEREQTFAERAQGLAEREARIKELQEQLENTTDQEEATRLQLEIAADTEKYDLVKSLADIAYEQEFTIREQVQALENKIRMDQQALDELMGNAPVPAKPEPAKTPSPAPVPAPSKAPSATGTNMIPGLPIPITLSGGKSSQPTAAIQETAVQLEARQQAEKAEGEAQLADQAVFSFLERKAALQEQIDIEESLLNRSRQEVAAFQKGRDIRQQELDLIKESGAPQEVQQAENNLDEILQAQDIASKEADRLKLELEGLYSRMQSLQEEQQAVTQEALKMREGAAKARAQSIWLESPLNPVNVLRWAKERGPEMLGIIVIATLVLLLIKKFVQSIARSMVGKGRRDRADATTRADTLALSFGSAATMIISILAVLLVLEAAGIDIATILGGAAILGVAIAFGAQNLMRDYFNGFIILIEDQYELNDRVTINNITGRVERVSLRTTALRDLKGKLHFIPNGEIKSVTNRSYEWAQIVFDIRVSYKENVDHVMEELINVARDVYSDPDFKGAILEEPTMLGVDQFAQFGIIIRFIMRTDPTELFRVKRETLRRIKNRLDELGIEIPVPPGAAAPNSLGEIQL